MSLYQIRECLLLIGEEEISNNPSSFLSDVVQNAFPATGKESLFLSAIFRSGSHVESNFLSSWPGLKGAFVDKKGVGRFLFAKNLFLINF